MNEPKTKEEMIEALTIREGIIADWIPYAEIKFVRANPELQRRSQ
jgi:hypothetical protein